MAKSKVEEGEVFTLNEIVDFIGSVEQGTSTCAWSTTKQLPREISILGYQKSSRQKTDSRKSRELEGDEKREG